MKPLTDISWKRWWGRGEKEKKKKKKNRNQAIKSRKKCQQA